MAFTVIVILSGVSGLLMVLGGMVLLYRGAISLTEASKDPALEAELPKIKIKTFSPALGLFIIGLAFIGFAAWTSKPREVALVTITGKVTVPRPTTVTIIVSSDNWGQFESDSEGRFEAVISPNLKLLKFTFQAPGFDPIVRKRKMQEMQSGTLTVEDVRFEQRKTDMPPVRPGNIASPNSPLPDLSHAGSF